MRVQKEGRKQRRKHQNGLHVFVSFLLREWAVFNGSIFPFYLLHDWSMSFAFLFLVSLTVRDTMYMYRYYDTQMNRDLSSIEGENGAISLFFLSHRLLGSQ
jgi:hypothetical protein